MQRPSLSVVQKIAAGYLLLTLFGLIALGFALYSLHRQTRRSQRLVAIEFRTANLLRDLHETVLAQERLEQQLLVLRDPQLQGLRENRRREFAAVWEKLRGLEASRLDEAVRNLEEADRRCDPLFAAADWSRAGQCSQNLGSPARENLLANLEAAVAAQSATFDDALRSFPEQSRRAFQITLVLILAGLGLSAPAALTVILGIHRATGALVRATEEIAAGNFDYAPRVPGRDEFARVADGFKDMACKLRELEQRCLDANPLTRLPGNLVIDREIAERISREEAFAHLYIDLDNFKAYGDRYGYRAGSNVLAEIGDMIHRVVRTVGETGDFVGHIGGDDYVVLAAEERAAPIGHALVREFDRMVPGFYSGQDRQAGCFRARDRYGVEREFPLMTISVAVVKSTDFTVPNAAAISRECAKMKEHLKELPGSNLLVNRRHYP